MDPKKKDEDTVDCESDKQESDRDLNYRDMAF